MSLNNAQKNFIDTFRIIALVLVVFGHGLGYLNLSKINNEQYFPFIQNVGVVMFFLLSGFLTINSLELKYSSKEDYNLVKYIKHKFVRIYSELLPAMLFILLIDYISIKLNKPAYEIRFPNAFNVKDFIGNILMLQGTSVNYIKILNFIPFGSARPLWTLSIEWWFYMVTGQLYFVIKNNKSFSLKDLVIIIFFSLMPINYYISGRGNGLGFLFLLGILIYYLIPLTDFCTIALPISAIVLYVISGIVFKEAYNIISFYFMFLIMYLFLAYFKSKNSKRNNIISFICKFSFIIYLIHYSVLDFVSVYFINWGSMQQLLIFVLICIISTSIIYNVSKVIKKAVLKF